jgi:ATP-binding cassette subfamily B protein
MLAVQQLLGQAVVPLALLPSLLQSLQAARLSLERLSEISSQPAEAEGAPAPRNAAAPRISLRDVAFSYGGRRDPLALSGIDLDFRPGTVTAIVGPSGSGKSTLLKLLLAFFRPSRGVILIDGVPLAEVPPASWRARCGVVQQDGYLFNDTLSNNIALGVEVPDQSRVRRAAELANACEFVDAFPQGFATRVGRNGQGLSQGQRQRILIARALYRDPAVLILDEATSALDSANEALITRGLQSCFSNRTVIVMAHRLSTVRNADRIAVLESGCVAEVGNHDELIARRGAYYRLVETQVELGAGRTVA